jgi:hypothetical protein
MRYALVLPMIAVAFQPPATPQTPVLADVLKLAGEYVAGYERALPRLAVEEQSLQRVMLPNEDPKMRALRADLSVVLMPNTGWTAFRDVFEVDGKPTRERDERLSKLLQQPTSQSLSQARQITEESARQQLLPDGIEFRRLLEEPLTPLAFLRAANQARSVFKLDGVRRYVGREVIVLRFTERGKPRLIATVDDAPAAGAFWIDPASGQVLSSDITMETKSRAVAVTAAIRIAYEEDIRLKTFVPVSMDEQYDLAAGPRALRIEGRTTYSKHRVLAADAPAVR